MKIMYSINDPFVVDHNDIFINLDPGYSGSFHDVTILKYFELNVNWRCMFFHNDDYFEYILGDPGLQGRQIYIYIKVTPIKVTTQKIGRMGRLL